MRTVFISHSCKDNEVPPAAPTPEQAARQARLVFARKLRDALEADLLNGGTFRVFLDKRELTGGKIWQDSLHDELRRCAAGVVLLTPESLESGWVLKEATILSWRVFQREPVLLVPVVVDVTDADLATRGFGALALNQIQWVRVTETGDAAVTKAVRDIAAALAHIPPLPLTTATELPRIDRWIVDLADTLQKATETKVRRLETDFMVRMCTALSIHPDQRGRFGDDEFQSLAAQALLAGQNQIVDFVNEAASPQQPLREALRRAVASLWVDPVPASRLVGGGSVIAIDAKESASVREYIQRAFCNRIDGHHIVEPTDVTTGSDDAVVDEVVGALEDYYDVDDIPAIAAEVDRRGPIFVILGPGSVRETVLNRLTARFTPITFVTAAGASPKDRLGAWWNTAPLLQPLLQPKGEKAAERFRNKLQAFVTG